MARIAVEARVMQGGYPGIGRATAGLLEALLQRDDAHRYLLIVDPRRPEPPAVTAARQAGHGVVPVPASLRGPANQLLLPLRLQQSRADLYHATYFGTALALPIPLVLSVWDLIPEHFPRYWNPPAAVAIRAWLRWQSARATALLAPSRATVQDLVRLYHVEAGKMSVAPACVPAMWTTRLPAQRSVCPYALCVSTNKPHKNLVRLVEGYAQARREDPDIPALVIAGGWDRRYPQPEQRAATLEVLDTGPALRQGSVSFVHAPPDDRLQRLYAGALFFLFPSEYEGFGLPVLEAMLAGLPVAASSTPAVQEVAGTAALSFDPHDSSAIAAAFLRLAHEADLRETLVRAGAERATHFAAEKSAARTVAVYDQVLRGAAIPGGSDPG